MTHTSCRKQMLAILENPSHPQYARLLRDLRSTADFSRYTDAEMAVGVALSIRRREAS